MRRILVLLAFLLATAGSLSAQQAGPTGRNDTGPKAQSYAFVSPNTRENLSLQEALRLLGSKEEASLIRAERKLNSCLGLKTTVLRSIGSWSDGAEHSTVFKTRADEQTLRYADARLGKSARQKSVLYFQANASGAGAMYMLYPKRGGRNLARLSRILDQSGVAFRTLVPRRHRSPLVYVVDLKNELGQQVAAAARRLRARLMALKVTGAFLGDDSDREKAQKVFAEEIERYESAHGQEGRVCAPEFR